MWNIYYKLINLEAIIWALPFIGSNSRCIEGLCNHYYKISFVLLDISVEHKSKELLSKKTKVNTSQFFKASPHLRVTFLIIC